MRDNAFIVLEIEPVALDGHPVAFDVVALSNHRFLPSTGNEGMGYAGRAITSWLGNCGNAKLRTWKYSDR